MKKLFSLLVAAMMLTVSQAQQFNDPNVVVRQVSGFNSIRISNAIDLYLTQGTEEAVAVSADKAAYRDHIKTVVEGGVLKITYENVGDGFKMGNRKLKAYVAIKTLVKLSASGASDVLVSGRLTGDELSIDMNGASDFKGSIEYKKLDIKLSGASDANITGTVQELIVDVNGASDLKAYELRTDNCVVDASGASDVKITVNKELKARASGASGIYYRGDGVIKDIKSSGASTISSKN